MVSGRAFIYHMCVPCGKMFSLVPRLRSSVMVAVVGTLVLCKHSLFYYKKNYISLIVCIFKDILKTSLL